MSIDMNINEHMVPVGRGVSLPQRWGGDRAKVGRGPSKVFSVHVHVLPYKILDVFFCKDGVDHACL